MKKINLFFAVQVLCTSSSTSGVYIFKYLKKTRNGILNGGKTPKERILKKYLCLWNTLFWISTYKKYVKNNNLSVSAKITSSLSQFREAVKLKFFKENTLQWLTLQKQEPEIWQNIKKEQYKADIFWKLITSRQHSFLFLKNTKKLAWIYWKRSYYKL